MSTRHVSGYARQEHEFYPTPAWVLDVLAEHVPLAYRAIWEPACGQGHLVRALEKQLANVVASDLNDHPGCDIALRGVDFLKGVGATGWDGIVSNPPFGPRGETAVAFIRRGLELIKKGGFLALLLPSGFDNAITRADLFENCPAFAAKIAIRKRIMWFPGEASPKENHAWFVWEYSGAIARGAPRLLYGPKIKEAA